MGLALLSMTSLFLVACNTKEEVKVEEETTVEEPAVEPLKVEVEVTEEGESSVEVEAGADAAVEVK